MYVKIMCKNQRYKCLWFLLLYLSKMMQGVWTFFAHFRDETHSCQQDAMVLLIQ